MGYSEANPSRGCNIGCAVVLVLFAASAAATGWLVYNGLMLLARFLGWLLSLMAAV